jgi:hypothetical protein
MLDFPERRTTNRGETGLNKNTVVDLPQGFCHFGQARGDITPPVGIYHRMWGAALHDQAEGVHRPLTATALVFQAAGQPAGPATEVVVLAVDHCILGTREMDDLIDSVCAPPRLRQPDTEPLPPLQRHQILVAFSHTHAAGLMDRVRGNLPGGEFIGPYLDDMNRKLNELVATARRSCRPASLTFATGHCALAAHRDLQDTVRGQIVCGYNPEGPADDTLLVARVSDEANQTITTIVNYACHPTTLAWENRLISPDFPGAMRELVEQSTEAPCVFLQGASGDLGPVEGFVGDPAVADRNGRQLGYAALSVLETLPQPFTRFQYAGPVVSGATLGPWVHVPLGEQERESKSRWRFKSATVPIAYRTDLPTLDEAQAERARYAAEEVTARAAGDILKARDCRAMVERRDRQLRWLANQPKEQFFPLPMTLWQTGDAIWLAVECEPYHILQRSLRDRFPDTPIMVMTVVNNSRASYLPPRESYGKGIYQESIAVLGPGCLETLIDAAAEQIADWL